MEKTSDFRVPLSETVAYDIGSQELLIEFELFL